MTNFLPRTGLHVSKNKVCKANIIKRTIINYAMKTTLKEVIQTAQNNMCVTPAVLADVLGKRLVTHRWKCCAT